MRKIGKIGRRNIEANKKIWLMYFTFDIQSCEVKGAKCMGTWNNQTAHRHTRQWYRAPDRQELLYAYKQCLRICPQCHADIEGKKEVTEQLFMKLRGDE